MQPRPLLHNIASVLRQDASDLVTRVRNRAEHTLCDLAWRLWFGPRQDSRPAARSVPATHEGRAAGREAEHECMGDFGCPACSEEALRG